MANQRDYKKRHRLFINPYQDSAFTKCPKCCDKTKVRKFPLAVHVEPRQILLLNMECKYCANCDLIIVKQSVLDENITISLQQFTPSLVGNDYLVFGTVDRNIWRASRKESLDSSDVIDHVYVFEDKLDFIPAWKS